MTKVINLNIRSLGLIGPNFFSYIQAIRDEFISRGYKCIYFDERHSNSLAAKLFYRLGLTSFVKRSRDNHLANLLTTIITSGITDVFLIDVEVVTVSFVKSLRERGINVHLYMWDSSKNKDSFLQLLPLLTSKASFEPSDCKQYEMSYIPLFAEKIFNAELSNNSLRKHEIVFLGTLHSHRANNLLEVECIAKNNGFNIRKLLYYHSHLLYIIKCISNPLSIRYLFALRTQGYTKQEIATAYFESKAVLDIHHPGQTGLTSRTFEALRSGCWLITINKTISTLPDELKSRIIMLSDFGELTNRISEAHEVLPPLSIEMDYFLSLERFVDDLLCVSGLDRHK